MTTNNQSLPPLPVPDEVDEQGNLCNFSLEQVQEYGDARVAHARTLALESLLAQFNQPHQEYFGDAIQDAIKELLK